MQIATWNVNSVRSRLDHVTQWLTANPVEILCLQETKVVDEQFPTEAIADLGYHPYISGQKSYNGVAILSREPLGRIERGFAPIVGSKATGDLDDQKRVILGVWGDALAVVNLYVPNGSAIASDKYEYKLRWLTLLRQYLATLLVTYPALLVCGDFNIAPDDRDIHDPEGKDDHIMASPAERQALQDTLFSLGFQDAFRQFIPEGGHFSWWDYRAGSFRRNRGWRIDHHYLSPALQPRAQGCRIDTEPRGWEKPSDHTPVVVVLGD